MEKAKVSYIPGYFSLRISGDNLDLDEITKMIGVMPSYSYKKGERRRVRIVKELQEVIYSEDCWIKQYKIPKQTEIYKALGRFLNKLLPKTYFLNDLAKKARITLWISVYPEDIRANINLPNKIIQSVSNMGIDMDVSFSFLQDFYNGNY
jgi:hypothetical protein